MTFDELLASLPNGLHDAEVCQVNVDYERAEVVWVAKVDLSDGGEPDPDFRPVRIKFVGVTSIVLEASNVVEPPSAGSEIGCVSGDAESGQPSTSPDVRVVAPLGGFLCWFFASELNSFIRVAARSVSLDWVDDN